MLSFVERLLDPLRQQRFHPRQLDEMRQEGFVLELERPPDDEIVKNPGSVPGAVHWLDGELLHVLERHDGLLVGLVVDVAAFEGEVGEWGAGGGRRLRWRFRPPDVLLVPGVQQQLLDVGHVHAVEFFDAEDGEERLDRRHAVATGQRCLRVVQHKGQTHFFFGRVSALKFLILISYEQRTKWSSKTYIGWLGSVDCLVATLHDEFVALENGDFLGENSSLLVIKIVLWIL